MSARPMQPTSRRAQMLISILYHPLDSRPARLAERLGEADSSRVATEALRAEAVGLITRSGGWYRLTPAGLERAVDLLVASVEYVPLGPHQRQAVGLALDGLRSARAAGDLDELRTRLLRLRALLEGTRARVPGLELLGGP